MRTIAAILAATLLAAQAAAQPLPAWSISDICRPDSAPGQCERFEARARNAVSGSWDVLQPAIRSACLAAIQSDKDRSWRNLAGCIETESERLGSAHGTATKFTQAEPLPLSKPAEGPPAGPAANPPPATGAAAQPAPAAQPQQGKSD